MENANTYLLNVIQMYEPKNLSCYWAALVVLKLNLKAWFKDNLLNILDSGSRVKGTAISLGSDIDLLLSLASDDNVSLESIYNYSYTKLKSIYSSAKKQNVSIRIQLPADSRTQQIFLPGSLEVDITPARRQSGNTANHSLWVSKLSTWKQTNIQQHINDVFRSGRTHEIKLLKIWRELNRLDFPSIYLEYLLIKNILRFKPYQPDSLADNFRHILFELAKTARDNPLFARVVDPANSNNILSDLLNVDEKNKIILAAKNSVAPAYHSCRSNQNLIFPQVFKLT